MLLLPPRDLNALCRVCKDSHDCVTAALYRRVELLFVIYRHSNMVQHQQLDNYTDCYRRQRLFCDTVIARPELGKHVREISWTLSFPVIPEHPLPPWKAPELPDSDDDDPISQLRRQHMELAGPFEAPTDPFQSARPLQVWKTFSLIDQVLSVDLRFHQSYERFPDPSPYSFSPSVLFPNAQAVKLSGPCSVEFAQTIFSHNTPRIKSLSIDHLDSISDYTVFLGWSALVKSALPTLSSLEFRKIGAISPGEPFDSAGERSAFTELATALETARDSIQYIHIGSTVADHGCVVYSIGIHDTTVSQGHFEELILPT